MKLMSFRLTLPQLLLGMKSVTRRAGWRSLQDGALIQAVDQQMGLKPGQRPIRIAPLLVLSARREPLHAITDAEATLEGFPDKTGEEFARKFSDTISNDDGMVTRIEFRPAAQDGIPALGSRVNVYGRKRGLDGVVVGHVLPGDDAGAAGQPGRRIADARAAPRNRFMEAGAWYVQLAKEMLVEAWSYEPGCTLGAFLNAVTRSAHTNRWSDDEEDALEAQAGAMLYQQVRVLDLFA